MIAAATVPTFDALTAVVVLVAAVGLVFLVAGTIAEVGAWIDRRRQIPPLTGDQLVDRGVPARLRDTGGR